MDRGSETIADTFAAVAEPLRSSGLGSRKRAKRHPPFSIRLTPAERAQLEAVAAGLPLGAYIKAKALDGVPLRRRASGQPIEDRTALAQVLALLGRSHLASNLNQLAKLANTGSLPLTPEITGELLAAIEDVRDMRRTLLTALGLKLDSAR